MSPPTCTLKIDQWYGEVILLPHPQQRKTIDPAQDLPEENRK